MFDEKTYKIGEVSNLTGSTIAAIRYYQKVGLIKPSIVDELTGYRYFTSDEILKIKVIHQLRKLELSISDIKIILEKPLVEILEIIKSKLDKLDNELRRIEKIREELLGLEKVYEDQIDFKKDFGENKRFELKRVKLENYSHIDGEVLSEITNRYGKDVKEVGLLKYKDERRVFLSLYSDHYDYEIQAGNYRVYKITEEEVEGFLEKYEKIFLFLRFTSVLDWDFEARLNLD